LSGRGCGENGVEGVHCKYSLVWRRLSKGKTDWGEVMMIEKRGSEIARKEIRYISTDGVDCIHLSMRLAQRRS
jgi:hypothetical protein